MAVKPMSVCIFFNALALLLDYQEGF